MFLLLYGALIEELNIFQRLVFFFLIFYLENRYNLFINFFLLVIPGKSSSAGPGLKQLLNREE